LANVAFWCAPRNCLKTVAPAALISGIGPSFRIPPQDAGLALVLGVEYLHYGFPEQTITLGGHGGGGTAAAFRAKENIDIIKGRISYLFSIH
jgi:hypothetical protein